MPRIVVSSFAHAVVLSLAALPLPLLAQDPAQPDAAAPLPVVAGRPNIQIDPLLLPLVEKLLRQSPTVRRQWETIAASRLVRVTLISSTLLRESSAARARTAVSRYAFGSIHAVVALPSAVDITELLAHELEHVLEQAEGLDLPALSKDGSSGVLEMARGVYETDRARNAGFAAMREVYGQTDLALTAAVRGVRRALAALIPGARAATGAAAGPGGGTRRQRRLPPAGAAKREAGLPAGAATREAGLPAGAATREGGP